MPGNSSLSRRLFVGHVDAEMGLHQLPLAVLLSHDDRKSGWDGGAIREDEGRLIGNSIYRVLLTAAQGVAGFEPDSFHSEGRSPLLSIIKPLLGSGADYNALMRL
jgi:hypothetical protein